MESSSIAAPPTTDREEDVPPDPSLSPSAAPLPTPAPPLPSASTKRRWSPCTWRYAIEEAQADLPSRSRSTTTTSIAAAFSGSGAHPPTSSRPPSHHPQQHHPHPIKAKPPSHHNPSFSKSAESAPQRNSSHHVPSRGYPPSTELHVRPSAHTSSKSRTTELSTKKSLQHELLSAKVRVSEKEEEEKEDDADQDDPSEDGDGTDGRVMRFDEEYFKRKRREMSPSELYFCTDCAAAKSRAKLSNDQS
ncbi:hypothetical protein L7F22_027324 [Adiantum nelumboides]|nr:hypothetical protein [Adiantum nelumboides]